MDATKALASLKQKTDYNTDPVLSADDLTMLLAEQAATVDDAGRDPDAAGWVPTYSLKGIYRAAAEGLRLKITRLSQTAFDVKLGSGKEFARSQKIKALREQIADYEAKAGGGTSSALTSIQLKSPGYV